MSSFGIGRGKLAAVAIVVVLFAAGVSWWRVAPGTGMDGRGAVRYQPRCSPLKPLPAVTATTARGIRSGDVTATYAQDEHITIYFFGPDDLSGGVLELQRRSGLRWVPERWAPLDGQLVVERLRDVQRRYVPRHYAGFGPIRLLKAIAFDADLRPGEWRACFPAESAEAGRGHVVAPFNVIAAP